MSAKCKTPPCGPSEDLDETILDGVPVAPLVSSASEVKGKGGGGEEGTPLAEQEAVHYRDGRPQQGDDVPVLAVVLIVLIGAGLGLGVLNRYVTTWRESEGERRTGGERERGGEKR